MTHTNNRYELLNTMLGQVTQLKSEVYYVRSAETGADPELRQLQNLLADAKDLLQQRILADVEEKREAEITAQRLKCNQLMKARFQTIDGSNNRLHAEADHNEACKVLDSMTSR